MQPPAGHENSVMCLLWELVPINPILESCDFHFGQGYLIRKTVFNWSKRDEKKSCLARWQAWIGRYEKESPPLVEEGWYWFRIDAGTFYV